MSDLLARVALSRVLEPGHRGTWSAVEARGAESVWEAVRRGQGVPELPADLLAAAAARAAAYEPQRDVDAAQRCGARILTPGSPGWPEHRLFWPRDVGPYAPPLLLYVRGPVELAEATERSVAVVGARAATVYGAHVAKNLGHGLADRGYCVVSGAAYGIDAAAHRGALLSDRAPTVAVLACGVDVAYPRGNDRLLASICERGLLVSELPPGARPTRPRFLVRNRVIAALSLGTVVVEAALRSGSLATAGRARELHRHVMVVPGSVLSAQSAGVHRELRDGSATCVTGVADVLDVVGRLGDDAAVEERGPEHPRDALEPLARQVLEAVPLREPATETAIALAAGTAPRVVNGVLPPLLVAGLVERVEGRWRLTALGAGRPVAKGSR